MSGLPAIEVAARSAAARLVAKTWGLAFYCPVKTENIQATPQPIQASRAELKKFWKRDKEMIDKSDVLIDIYADQKSDGVYWEMGYAKYRRKIPVVRVYRRAIPECSISGLEADYLANCVSNACKWIKENVKRRRA